MPYDYIVIGGSAAGTSALTAIERADPQAHAVLLERTNEPPHDRPSLSKQLLTRQAEDETSHLRTVEEWADSTGELRLGAEAVSIGADRSVLLASGERLEAKAIVLAPGCTPRSLPMVDGAPNAVSLRDISDLRKLRELITPSSRVVLIGGGFIGLEVASSLVSTVASVTVIEREEMPLARIVGEDAAAWLMARPARAGVKIRTSASVVSHTRRDDHAINSVLLSTGEVLAVDVVVVGIGVVPATGWLQGSPIALTNGIAVDEYLQTSLPGVFAAGDAVEFLDLRIDTRTRIEHWTTAGEQGRAAGANAVAWRHDQPLSAFNAVPYVWSDQYGNKIQIAGHTRWATRIEVRMATDDKLFVEYFADDTLCAVLGVNLQREVMMARRTLATATTSV